MMDGEWNETNSPSVMVASASSTSPPSSSSSSGVRWSASAWGSNDSAASAASTGAGRPSPDWRSSTNDVGGRSVGGVNMKRCFFTNELLRSRKSGRGVRPETDDADDDAADVGPIGVWYVDTSVGRNGSKK